MSNKNGFFIFSCIFFLANAHCITAYANSQPEYQNINGQIEQIQTTLNQEHQELKASEITLAKLTLEIAHINQQQAKEELKLSELKNQEHTLQTKLSSQHDALAQQVRAAYQLGKLNEIKILFNQENPYTLSRHLGYYRYLTKERLDLISATKETLHSLTETMQSITDHKNDLQKLLVQKKQQQEKQELTQKLRQRLIAQLNQKVQTKQQQSSIALANQQALQETFNQLPALDNLNKQQPFANLQGKLAWPTRGKLIASFGSPLSTEGQHLSGVIIQAPQGTPVKAISSGKVVFANWLRGFGLLVIIDHGNNYMSLYARNQALHAKVGEKVKPGDLIASLGNTGGYELSSLYFEIRKNGIPINPSFWCRNT